MDRDGFWGGLIHTLLSLSFLFGVFLVAIGLLLMQEVNDFQARWGTEEKLLLLQHGNALVVGIAGTFTGEQPHVLTTSELGTAYKGWKEQNEALLLRNYQMTVLVTMEAFSSVAGDVSYAGIPLSLEQVKSLVLDPTPGTTLGFLLRSKGITAPLPVMTDAQLKGLLFLLLFEEAVKQDPTFLIRQYRAGRIMVVPASLMFTLLKYAPGQFYESLKTPVTVQLAG